MAHYFVTGYDENGRFSRVTVTSAPEGDAERGQAYDALLYSDAAQDEGMLAFGVEAQDDQDALVKGCEAYADWR